MYLLVNLEDHRPQMGEIIASLVNTWSVPISIVDKVEKLCPKCSRDEKISSDTPSTAGDQFSCSPSPVPSKCADEDCPNSTGPSTVGRRTAAKQSAIIKALERKPLSNTEAVFQPLSEEQSSSVVANSPVSASFLMGAETKSVAPLTLDDAPQEDFITYDTEGNTEEAEAPAVNYESLHPSLLACLLSATPNMFGQNAASSSNNSSNNNNNNNNNNSQEKQLNNMPRPSPSFSKKRSLVNVVSVTGKVRRGRVVYSAEDLDILEKYYKEDPNACANPQKKQALMTLLGIDAVRLKVWFQNRRRKDKVNWLNAVESYPDNPLQS